ncbi:huntingtin-interacting protein 1 [Battus philenor]|uniref:huntingtin-interacting protein 1 n=1 Tax=Battus philenor TaxID=42288 RepID=UPI0035D05B30
MASLSLPRVLQLKKNSLDAEREQFEKFQTLAIQKAINSIETPVKEKHVRSTIIGTFQEQSAVTYWMVAIRQPLQDNRIVAWKFCHVTHKLLREGHPACLDDSQRHIGMIENLGKLWVHLREGYGRLIHLYCSLLVCKLKFHQRNPRFPGNMQLTADELDAIAENDVNNYFQLCVELFDYMDDILNLQAAVFESLGNARANSMTASGQCRLAALIPCAQDSSHIYDCNVRLLFRLHAALPADTLVGHRERFRQQFKKLSSFYKHASSLQYYRNLLTLPVLPSNPPNFLLQSDFGTYVTPVVSIPEPPPDEVDSVGSLIDTSDTASQVSHLEPVEAFDTRTTPSPQPDPIVERDRLIDHLQNELKRMRTEVSQLVQERNTMLGSMREHCTRLESQLHATKSELETEKQKAEILSAETPGIKQKLVETEDRAKVIDEKFQKLKGAYTQLREEHIALIRQKAEVDKMASGLRAAAAQHESAKLMLQQQLNDRIKDEELLQQSASSSEEIEAYKNEISNLRTELENSRQKEVELESLRASMETLEIEHKTATAEQQEKVISIANELKEITENFDRVQKEKEEKETELNKTKQELMVIKQKNEEELKIVMEEKESALQEIADLKQQYQQEKQKLSDELLASQESNKKIQNVLITLQDKNCEYEKDQKVYNERFNNQLIEIDMIQQKIDELQKTKDSTAVHVEQLQVDLNNMLVKLKEMEDLTAQKDTYTTQLKNRLEEIESEKNIEIQRLQQLLSEKTDTYLEKINENEKFLSKISELESSITKKDENISELQAKLNEELICIENERKEFEVYQNQTTMEITSLRESIQHVSNSKEEAIVNYNEIITEKDKEIITLRGEINKSLNELVRVQNELKETHVELETTTNNLLSLKEDLTNLKNINDADLAFEHSKYQKLSDEFAKLTAEKIETETENHKVIDELTVQKQVSIVLENDKRTMHENIVTLNNNISALQFEKVEIENKLNSEIEQLKKERENLINMKNTEIKNLQSTIDLVVAQRDEITNQIHELNTKRDDLELLLSEKEKENQMVSARLEHTETERLNAECELQDLLQHNTVLEADVASMRAQLQEAKAEIKRQTSRLVTCASEAALEVTNGALHAFEHGSVGDTNRLAAEMAAKAFEELAKTSEVEGSEEAVAKSAVFAAHNTAQLSSYITDLCNVSTDMELSDKLSNECRTMLSSTKACLEALGGGRVERRAWEAALEGVRKAGACAGAVDRQPIAGSVDDELATMDTAIEQAAAQIEEMLAASRAADSGVKLEVNEKILDACTTLMGAVKVLVQDARKLQNELGDIKTRQKMYRRNPQWSEGLISAAKAVVFAAKLLVSSADETVNGKGRVEGVSAAVHSVAGSTAQLVAASRARAPPAAPSLARLTAASRHVAAAAGAVLAAARHAADLARDTEALDTSALTLTATRILEMESKVRSLELETALEAERVRLAELRKRHYQLAQLEENADMTNGKE